VISICVVRICWYDCHRRPVYLARLRLNYHRR
jgi:hypothetical protein